MRKKILAILIFLFPYTLQAQSFTELFDYALAIHTQKPEKALELLKKALEYNPDSIETQYNLAYILKNLGRSAESLAYYNMVLKKDPLYVGAHIGKGQACLMLGDYGQGWKELEWRLGTPDTYTQELKHYLANNGSLRNKKILLRAEWGIGDAIMLIRYAQLLHEQGAYVMVHLLHDSLVPLFKQQPYLNEVTGPNQPAPPFHFQLPMISLPRLFDTTLDTIPGRLPYMQIDADLIIPWSRYFMHTNGLKIGICWHGNTIHGEEKFMPLCFFAQLAQIPNITLYSLQQRHGLEQIEALENPTALHIFDASFDRIPFLDTAAVMKNLDLVITVDTSIAHLAGALNVPTWVVLPYHADWRWMQERSDTPWYSSMRLFRQKSPGDWQSILEELKQALIQRSSVF